MGSQGTRTVSPETVPKEFAWIPVDPTTLPGRAGDVNGLGPSMLSFDASVPGGFTNGDPDLDSDKEPDGMAPGLALYRTPISTALGFGPNREPVESAAREPVSDRDWSGQTVGSTVNDVPLVTGALTSNGDYGDASTVPALCCDLPNIISPFTGMNDGSDFEADSPDLVFVDSNELPTDSAEQSVTFDNDVSAVLFDASGTTVGAGCIHNDSVLEVKEPVGLISGACDLWSDDLSSAESSLLAEDRIQLELLSQEISTVADEFQLDCLAVWTELDGILGLLQTTPGESF